MSSVRSMTGFGSVNASPGEGPTCTLTIKGVNHRFLDVSVRLPGGFDVLVAELRRTIKASVARGHVEVTLEIARADAGQGLQVNAKLLRSLVEELRSLATDHGLSTELDVVGLLRVPGVLVHESRAADLSPALLQEYMPALLEGALDKFQRARELEGAELAREMRESMRRLGTLLSEVRELRAGVRQAHFDRLRLRLRELLADAGVSDERLLTEAALLAEKSDVEEEAVRLLTHIASFVAMLDEGGAVGKRLDFLLQEFNREANTVLSKSGSAAGPGSTRLVSLGLEMKAEIERVREQVQNLE